MKEKSKKEKKFLIKDRELKKTDDTDKLVEEALSSVDKGN